MTCASSLGFSRQLTFALVSYLYSRKKVVLQRWSYVRLHLFPVPMWHGFDSGLGIILKATFLWRLDASHPLSCLSTWLCMRSRGHPAKLAGTAAGGVYARAHFEGVKFPNFRTWHHHHGELAVVCPAQLHQRERDGYFRTRRTPGQALCIRPLARHGKGFVLATDRQAV